MVSLAVDDWPSGASLSDADVDALHVAHHAAPRSVLGCHRRGIGRCNSNTPPKINILLMAETLHQFIGSFSHYL